MLSLPTPLQDAIRSHLNFLELHSSRAVCKRWRDIESIPKVINDLPELENIEKGLIPPHACVSHVTKLSLSKSWCFLDNDTGSLRLLFHILQSNQHTLQTLHISYKKDLPERFFIPKLLALNNLLIGASRSIVLRFLKNAPALKSVTIIHSNRVQDPLTSIDISEFPNIVNLCVPNCQFDIQNFSDGNLKKVEFFRIDGMDNWDTIKCYFEDPKLEITCDFWYEAAYVTLISTKQCLKLESIEFREENLYDVAMKLKDAAEKIQGVRMDADFDVKAIIQEASGSYLFQILHVLSSTEMFGDKELLKMALQSGQNA